MQKLWYFRATLIALTVCGLGFVSSAFLRYNAPPDTYGVIAETIDFMVSPLTAISGFCLFWLCPYFASGDDAFEFNRPPRRATKDLEFVLWILPISVCIWGVLLIVASLLLNGLADINRDLILHGIILLAASFAMAIPNRWVSKRIGPRMIAMTRRRLICFECGYDLRGNADATTCPECGEAVPWFNQEKPIATDPTQDPAKHDRA
jgi:hypothetical protein